MENLRKIDIHAHLIESTLTPPHKATGHRFPTTDELLDVFYDKLDIEYGVILPIIAPEAQWFQLTNESAIRISEKRPDRFRWFCNLDPRTGENRPDTDLSYLLNYYKDLGAKGVGEITSHLYADDPFMDNLFYHCTECDMPALIHISPAPGVGYGIIDDPGLPRLEKMLKKHPKLRIIGHSQPFWAEMSAYEPGMDRNGYPTGKVSDGTLTRLMREYDNLYCDLSAGSGCNALTRDREHAAAFLTEFADRIYYGCDVCIVNNQHPFTLAAFLDDLLADGSIDAAVYRKICRENAAKLLDL